MFIGIGVALTLIFFGTGFLNNYKNTGTASDPVGNLGDCAAACLEFKKRHAARLFEDAILDNDKSAMEMTKSAYWAAVGQVAACLAAAGLATVLFPPVAGALYTAAVVFTIQSVYLLGQLTAQMANYFNDKAADDDAIKNERDALNQLLTLCSADALVKCFASMPPSK